MIFPIESICRYVPVSQICEMFTMVNNLQSKECDCDMLQPEGHANKQRQKNVVHPSFMQTSEEKHLWKMQFFKKSYVYQRANISLGDTRIIHEEEWIQYM